MSTDKDARDGGHGGKAQVDVKPSCENSILEYQSSYTDVGSLDFSTRLSPNLGPSVTPGKAAQELLRWNSQSALSPLEISATTRLYAAVRSVRSGQKWTSDIIIQMFPDIDAVFFGGRLLGNVHLTWVDASFLQEVHGQMEEIYGATFRLPENECQAWIWLNRSALYESEDNPSFMKVWACLLHEMCHAYQIVCVFPEAASPDSHGPDFQRMIDIVYVRSVDILADDADEIEIRGSHSLEKDHAFGGGR